jgi:ribA/ribD-fused uncharacterized protein
MIIYTDGSRIPGQDGRGYGGIGIWFGENDPRNTSISITSPNPTNQSAELMAIKYALTFCKEVNDILIMTDSVYSINCFTVWYKTWMNNGWKNSKHEDVVNSDLIKEVLDIIFYRDSMKYKTLFQHVRAHKDSVGNIGADKLAVAGSLKHEKYIMDNTLYFYNHNHGDYRCFSQFFPSIFTMKYDGEVFEYNCAEQHHHQQKALLFNDHETAAKIMTKSNPAEQKRLGRLVKNFNQKMWLDNCYQTARRCNIAKFSQNPDLLSVLVSTKGKSLAEASTEDCVWGIGISAAQSKSRVKWKGQNLLGKVLVDIRDNVFL